MLRTRPARRRVTGPPDRAPRFPGRRTQAGTAVPLAEARPAAVLPAAGAAPATWSPSARQDARPALVTRW
ncbi:hypothetical protein GCM10018787_06370 [Streptomyces thermodiastaticus]|nr:hypothetical protein GCM10018787_06370 [Streptomyces thermodiastaticus]